MPGTTPLGLRYPLQGETVNATSWQNLATDIDTLMTTVDGLRDRALQPATASIIGSFSATSLATATDGVYSTFVTVLWDTSGFANLGVNADRLTLSTGVYFARAQATLSGYTTMTYVRVGLLAQSRIWAMQNADTIAGSGLHTANAAGIVVITTASSALQVRIRWAGTGGPANFINGALDVYKIRELADV